MCGLNTSFNSLALTFPLKIIRKDGSIKLGQVPISKKTMKRKMFPFLEILGSNIAAGSMAHMLECLA
jgi:hypothetical protein